MNTLLANAIEKMGIKFFASINRKKSNSQIFKECNKLTSDEIKSIYSRITVFNKNEFFDEPVLINKKVVNGMDVNTYTMPSLYIPIKKYQNIYNTFSENKNIYFEHMACKNSNKKQKTALIYLHGFSERNYNNETKYLFANLVKQYNDLDILAVQQPFHMLRSPNNQPYSGAYIFDSCPIVTIEGIRQSVNDVSQVISYAKQNYTKVIVGGFSLGGHVTSFLGTCDDRADLYIMGQAGAKLPETLNYLSVCPGLYAKKDEWINSGQEFELLYDPIELLKYNPIIPKEKVVSVAGFNDRLVTYERVEELRNLFKSQYNIDYKSGHIGLLLEWKVVMKPLLKIIDEELGE
ncbi:alpha/beta hydrolase family protein [Vallitalea maricola]|uniref:Uncharacterized protein n=1 Tax=Vallitalea maricola TaxID=3074433 RepID=A0ACB5UM17_9FIRM|nr:hypothetical protein AN2V17_28330 [Vallitalea sp. AN17-2]